MEGKEKVIKIGIVKKVCEVMKTIGAIPKASKNVFYNYNYRSHEDITNKLQPALAEHGVVIIPTEKRMIISEPGYVLLEVTYKITDGNESILFIGIGEGIDKSKDGKPGDKAAYIAQTGAMKYALNDLLMLAGQDPEEDQKTHPDEPAKKQQPNQATSKKPPTATPQAKPAKYALTEQETSALVDVMDAMNYTDNLKSLGLQKARIDGPKEAQKLLNAKYVAWEKKKAEEAAKQGSPAK